MAAEAVVQVDAPEAAADAVVTLVAPPPGHLPPLAEGATGEVRLPTAATSLAKEALSKAGGGASMLANQLGQLSRRRMREREAAMGASLGSRAGRGRGGGPDRINVAQLIRGFPSHAETQAESAVEARVREQWEKDSALHQSFLASLEELRGFETELNLTFQAVNMLPSPNAPPQAAARPAPRAADDEIVLVVESQRNPRRSAGAQGLVLRAHAAFELLTQGKLASAREARRKEQWRPLVEAQDAAPRQASARCATPEVDGGRDVLGHYVGDGAHVLSLDLRERAPETVIIRRVRAQQGAEAAAEPEARGASGALLALEARCKRLRHNLREVLAGHVERRQREVEERQAEEAEAIAGSGLAGDAPMSARFSSRPTAAALSRASQVEAAPAAPPPGEVEVGYLRELRRVLRELSDIAPESAALVESSVKGLFLDFDSRLAAERRRCRVLEAHSANARATAAELESLRQELHKAREEIAALKEQMAKREQLREDEVRALQEKVADMKGVIQRLTPDATQIEGVGGVLVEYADLLNEMEEERRRQQKILHDMSSHARSLACASHVPVAADGQDGAVAVHTSVVDPSAMRSRERGRIVELPNGEIILRPYDAVERGTQVVDTDFKVGVEVGPIVLRLPALRLLLGANEGQETPMFQPEELVPEIDKIFAAKITADTEADWLGIPRRELPEFVVQHYLESTGSVERAQRKLCGMLECIRGIDRKKGVPQKVVLFARFLEYCEYEKALPLAMLDMTLQAKRHVQAALMRHRADADRAALKASRDFSGFLSRGGRRPLPTAASAAADAPGQGAPVVEPQIDVATAFDAATKALPPHSAGLRDLFASLAKSAAFDGEGTKRGRDFNVMALILQFKMQREQAPALRELVHRAEKREHVTQDEFRDAIRASGIGDIDDGVWRSRLVPHTGSAQPGNISGESLLDAFGGGAAAKFPRASVSESGFLSAVVDALSADYVARAERLRALWERRVTDAASVANQSRGQLPPDFDPLGPLGFADVSMVLQSAEPELTGNLIRCIFCTAVEVSRSCMQLEGGDRMSMVGSLRRARSKLYGGETVTFKLLLIAARKHRLFLLEGQKEAPAPQPPQPPAAAMRMGRGPTDGGLPATRSATRRPASQNPASPKRK